MSKNKVSYSVFTKPWGDLSVWDLGKFISGMGFDGIEYPLREGFQVEPQNVDKLPELAKQLAEHGLKIFSIASSTEEKVFAACAEAGVPLIRIMPKINYEDSYLKSLTDIRKQVETLLPLCEKYGVKIGIQPHCGNHIVDSMSLLRVVENLDKNHVGAIWDSAHDTLAGMAPEFGLDIVWDHLFMVNIKNAFYNKVSGPEAEEAEWKHYYTTGQHGLGSWPRTAAYLKKRNYNGVICLSAEYSNKEDVDRLIQQDIVYAKSLFG